MGNKCDEIYRELEQYRALGMVKELREAKEKQTPKKIEKKYTKNINGIVIHTSCYCSNCGEYIIEEIEYCGYCPECGYAVDWSGENEVD